VSRADRGGDQARRVWILNVDAERELERFAVDRAAGRPAGRPARYSPDANLRGILRREGPRAARRLLAADDLAWIDGALTDREGRPVAAEEARGALGCAWSPTPTAIATLERLGASRPDAPDGSILAEVNARPFTAALSETLGEGIEVTRQVVERLDQALAELARPAPLGWLVRRPFGAAGRGRRRLHSGAPTAEERAWLEASLRLGPLVIEPFVEVVAETTRCAWLEPDGRLTIAAPGLQSTDSQGAWLETLDAGADTIGSADDRRLLAALERAGAALHSAGYFGPFGIDAFWHRPVSGAPGRVLQPLSEINARYTMDWRKAGGGAR
jgi:hypothetical protein